MPGIITARDSIWDVVVVEPLEWAVGFFFGDLELSLELWTVIAGISGFDD